MEAEMGSQLSMLPSVSHSVLKLWFTARLITYELENAAFILLLKAELTAYFDWTSLQKLIFH